MAGRRASYPCAHEAAIGVLWMLGRSQIVCLIGGVLVTVAIRALA